MAIPPPPVDRAKRYVLLLCGILLLATAASAILNVRAIRDQYRRFAAVAARTSSLAIFEMRDWNLEQGGVYVPVGGKIRPNPYLRDPQRDVTTREGLRLTKINHAQMTRLISEQLTEGKGIRVHVTSARPLRPENAPDAWEAKALDILGAGAKEHYDVVPGKGGDQFRYMSVLAGGKSCEACHPGNDAETKGIQGGISVSFAYAPFERLQAGRIRQILLVHAGFLVLSFALVVHMGRRLVEGVSNLQASLLTIKRLEGLLPICARCKKIRLRDGDPFEESSWVAVEKYIGERTDAEFTHGLCPDCAKVLYKDFDPARDRADGGRTGQ